MYNRTQKIAYVTIPTDKIDAPLRPADLIGPVQLLKEANLIVFYWR